VAEIRWQSIVAERSTARGRIGFRDYFNVGVLRYYENGGLECRRLLKGKKRRPSEARALYMVINSHFEESRSRMKSATLCACAAAWIASSRSSRRSGRNQVGPTRKPSLHQRLLSRNGIRGGRGSFSRLISIYTIAGWLIAGIVFAAGSTPTATAGQSASPPGLGSADDYMQSKPYEPSDPESHYESAQLGIAVKSGTGELEDGRSVGGAEILTVIPGSPGGAAGLQGSSPRVFRTTALFVGMVAGAALFPPALIVVMALSKIGEPHQTIIAVDGERTRDVTEFEEAIEKADAGEVVYLTVVSGGQREQIRVALPVQ
jgi:hypothetical protein